MLDFVALAMAIILPLIFWSLAQVRKGFYQRHRQAQISIAVVLFIAVCAFELDMRINGWENAAKPSPWYPSIVFPVLYVHLFFSISTCALWAWTLMGARKNFSIEPRPNQYSSTHRRRGKLAVGGMVMTVITGWFFYYLAFISS